MDLASLKPGETYAFHTKDWEAPDGALVPGERKVRKFIRRINKGAVGLPKTPFIEVARDDGATHLIADETLLTVTPV